MIAVDTSALMALAADEPDASDIRQVIAASGPALVSAATATEFLIVAMGRSAVVYGRAQAILQEPTITIVPLDAAQSRLAADAYARFGKGRGHPAQLNFGDTFAYALASARRVPLLFKGGDFALTDLTPAAVESPSAVLE